MVRRYSNLVLVIFFTSAFSLLNNAVASKIEQNKQLDFDLILAGGGLSTCSSMSVKNCAKNDFSTDDLTEVLYRFSDNDIKNFQSSSFYLSLTQQKKKNINSLIGRIYSSKRELILTKSQVREKIKTAGLLNTYKNLSDDLYFALFDFFEFKQVDSVGLRKTEKVNLNYNVSLGSKNVYEAFYYSAKTKAKSKNKSRPTLIAITASSRDPFESADFYLGVLEQFDANVLWLPLDMNLQQAIEEKRCESLEEIRNEHLLFNRANIYPLRAQQQYETCRNPEELLRALKQADGIMFNGGDQSRTIAALTLKNGNASPFLSLLKQLNKQKQLVVAGTSAGTAVQAGGDITGQIVPMLTNGAPESALKRGAFKAIAPSARCSETSLCDDSALQPGDLTYRSEGGTGLFPFGLLDTHFSERNREVRLSVFAYESKTRLGFGVDEATALAVNFLPNGDYELTVVGENGVFVTDINQLPGNINQNPNKPNFVSGLAHFLNEGDVMTIDRRGEVINAVFAKSSKRLNGFNRATNAMKLKGTWRANTAKFCGSQKPIKWHKFDAQFLLKASEHTRFAKNLKRQCSYYALPYVISL